MIVPTVLATTARRSCTLCCASDRPVAEDIAIPCPPYAVLSWRTRPTGHCLGSLMLSAVAARKQGPRNYRSCRSKTPILVVWQFLSLIFGARVGELPVLDALFLADAVPALVFAAIAWRAGAYP